MEKFENLKRNEERFKVYRYLKQNRDALCETVKKIMHHQVIEQSKNNDFAQVLEWRTHQHHSSNGVLFKYSGTDQLALALYIKDEYVDWSDDDKNSYVALLVFDELEITPSTDGDVTMLVDATLKVGDFVEIENDDDTTHTFMLATLSPDDPVAHSNTAPIDFNKGNMDVVLRDIFKICDDIAIAINEAYSD